MSKFRTTDGRPLSMGISGFTHYDTERIDAPEYPAPVYSPEDLLKRIKEIREVLADERYKTAVDILNSHLSDTNNPHNTTLPEFTDDIIDVLYKRYVELGGIKDKDFYVQCLFQMLRIATESELIDATKELPPNVVLSVASARKFLLKHEVDENAHSELFQSIFPGTPTRDPVFGIMGDFGIASKFTVKHDRNINEAPYSYVGKNGYVQYCDDVNKLPVDYSYVEGMIPCFGTRTNLVAESNNFESTTKLNTTFISDAEVSPDKSITATAVFAMEELSPLEHGIILPNVYLPAQSARSFSIYAKAEKCRFLSIHYKDLGSSNITVRAVYDLKEGSAICFNHMNRYTASSVPLANGWYRCCFTMYHNLGQEHNLKILFNYTDENHEDFTFVGKNQLCGYLWGMQLEDGVNVSPFIKTEGIRLTRKSIPIKLDASNSQIPYDHLSIDMDFLNPLNINNERIIRPLLSLYKTVENDYIPSGLVELRSIGTIDTTTYSTMSVSDTDVVTITSQLVFPADNETKYTQMVYGVDKDSSVHKHNKAAPISMRNVDEWNRPDTIFIGCNQEGSFMDSYLKAVVIYPYKVSEDETIFLTGEQIYG